MNILGVSFLVAMAVVIATAAPFEKDEPIPILKQSQDGPNPDGSYSYSYETANGIQVQDEGALVPSKKSKENSLFVQGSFGYTTDDGIPIKLSYIANENGFQPKGAHLPVAPQIPLGVLKALEWIANHPEEDNL